MENKILAIKIERKDDLRKALDRIEFLFPDWRWRDGHCKASEVDFFNEEDVIYISLR